MKNFTFNYLVKNLDNKRILVLLLSLFLLSNFNVNAQRACNNTATTAANLVFDAPTFVSGTNNGVGDVGDVYRFSNVFAGVDALLTISAATGGATLANVDIPAVTEGIDGYDAAFQPTLNTNAGNPTSITFTINFVTSGGTLANPVRLNFYASPIDVDGDSAALREYDELTLPDAYFRNNPSGITFTNTATLLRGTATTSAVLAGTSTAPEGAFTCYYENRSSFTYTIGTLGATTVIRLKSLYFQNISYGTLVTNVLTPPLVCGNLSLLGGGGIPGATINLAGPNNQTTTTDASGNYSFAVPVASLGTYTITQTNLAGYSNVSDVDGANDNTINNNVFGFQSIIGRNFVDASANLRMTKVVNNLSPNYGSSVTFTLTVNNDGPGTATSVVVNDLLPAGYTYVSNNGGGSYNNTTGVWTIGTLANGGSASLQIVATVIGSGSYTNNATVSSAAGDPNGGNNTASASVTPVCNATIAPSLNKN
ncbi:DUF11 domain-containing protein [Flavobacterium sp.]|uniref:DUF11 domain-containing protein n=1 Tax=Flavobacterium sp. TaxID=239 RepID=UPI00260E9D6D|nr:DUF11 domain-containing protein [Flavobacterium sp.]